MFFTDLKKTNLKLYTNKMEPDKAQSFMTSTLTVKINNPFYSKEML